MPYIAFRLATAFSKSCNLLTCCLWHHFILMLVLSLLFSNINFYSFLHQRGGPLANHRHPALHRQSLNPLSLRRTLARPPSDRPCSNAARLGRNRAAFCAEEAPGRAGPRALATHQQLVPRVPRAAAAVRPRP
jgi:hypothetical protein